MSSIVPVATVVIGAGEPARATMSLSQPAAVPNRIVPAVVSIPQPNTRPHNGRPDPSFLAHLIATADGAPQTRTVRRATAQETVNQYLIVTKQIAGGTSPGQNFSRLA